MVSERIQRRIDAFLDEADEAAARRDWLAVAEAARAVLAIEEANADASSFLKLATANGASDLPLSTTMERGPGGEAPPPPVRPEPVEGRTPAAPESFVGGRYHVRKFLGEGGKKRVFLAHDQSLDRDVAFALIKTEGLDATGRERIVREAQAMGRMGTHAHVVTIFEIGDESGAPYVVTELMGGGEDRK